MKLYRTQHGIVVEKAEGFYSPENLDWDDLLSGFDPIAKIESAIEGRIPYEHPLQPLAPAVSQEVWAAGVTYYRSRDARIEESQASGAQAFYDRVYQAERPELFFKATGRRVIGVGGGVRIRSDARWSVPEPELTLVINSVGTIVGYTIGNDMSSRDIEAENPLYLPQAKIYDGSCALGPCILLCREPLPSSTTISLTIEREGKTAFHDSTLWSKLKRDPVDLVKFLFRENSFPHGVFLMTGTGIVPESDFTLKSGDIVSIQIDPIGILQNFVE